MLRGRCDSFVVETNVHYPTDINLLFDAVRKVIILTARLCESSGVKGWRQYQYNVKQLKRLMRSAQLKKRGGGKTETQKAARQAQLIDAHQALLECGQSFVDKARASLESLSAQGVMATLQRSEINTYIKHADRQIEQVKRRVLEGEVIPHEEKVFSIFESHTEWNVKGKAGVPVELGLKVCVLEDQHQFILHHHVMQKEVDSEIAVKMIAETKARFSQLSTCSFDKGFHSPTNQTALSEQLDSVALPRKGKLSEKAKAHQASDAYQQARHKHSAVESAINALEVHGLDRCPDKGLHGFKRYVALAVVARNLQHLGALLIGQEKQRLARQQKRSLQRAA